MRLFEFSFPGKLFNSTAVVVAYDQDDARKNLIRFILMQSDIADFQNTIDNIKFKGELGPIPKKPDVIYYFDGGY